MERVSVIVAGLGCRSGADERALRAALTSAGGGVTGLATLIHKEPLVAPVAGALGLPLILIDPRAIKDMETVTRSPASLAAYGTGSVAEAVALVAAGPGARLILPRIIAPGGQATCALAQGVSA